jgi:hypothetical protein
MTLNTELRSLLSDLKEHGLLDKYPDLEKAVKRGYRHLEFLDSESMPSVATTKPNRQIHDINKSLESCKEGLLEDLRSFK